MNNYDYYLVNRPLFSRFDRENGMPVIRRNNPKDIDFEHAYFINFSNINKVNSKSIILSFHDDKKINSVWNNPLNYIKRFKSSMAIVTPDYTIQRGMDMPLVIFNVYRNRWLGCTYQQYGINVIPSVSWADEETYDVCFSGIEKNSIIAISTIGCRGNDEKKVFLKGYKELIYRKNPSLVICFGGFINGMTGKVLPVMYDEGFGNKKDYCKIPLYEISKILFLKGDETYGW